MHVILNKIKKQGNAFCVNVNIKLYNMLKSIGKFLANSISINRDRMLFHKVKMNNFFVQK